MDPILEAIVVFLGAIFAATYGAIIGAGGGFIMVPVLLFLLPDATPAFITATSLVGVLVTGLSGTFAYRRLKRIDYKSGTLFALTTIPGAVLGAIVVRLFGEEQDTFRLMFGVFLTLIGIYIFLRPRKRPAAGTVKLAWGVQQRTLTDAQGFTHTYNVNIPLGMAFAFVIGFLAALMGIGGGLLLTPVMVTVLGFPPHIATATAVYSLIFTSTSAVGTHLVTGTLLEGSARALLVAAGMLLGAQLGARLSQRLSSQVLVRLLAVALVLVGLRLATSTLF